MSSNIKLTIAPYAIQSNTQKHKQNKRKILIKTKRNPNFISFKRKFGWLLFATTIGNMLGEPVIFVHEKIRERRLYYKNKKIYQVCNINDNFLMTN
jgi:tmRNA-binding protein